jgi:hypothetical protein
LSFRNTGEQKNEALRLKISHFYDRPSSHVSHLPARRGYLDILLLCVGIVLLITMLKHLLLPLTALVIVCADDYDHRYKEGDRVDLWVNKVRESIPKLQLLCEGRGLLYYTL